MPDITICVNKECDQRRFCYRHEAIPDSCYQSYSYFEPDKETKICDHFLPLKEKKMNNWILNKFKKCINYTSEMALCCNEKCDKRSLCKRGLKPDKNKEHIWIFFEQTKECFIPIHKEEKMFKFENGLKVKSNITGLTGIITARSENLNMCYRYYIQPAADKDMKIPDGWWVDEQEIVILNKEHESTHVSTGGPMNRIK